MPVKVDRPERTKEKSKDERHTEDIDPDQGLALDRDLDPERLRPRSPSRSLPSLLPLNVKSSGEEKDKENNQTSLLVERTPIL